MSAVAPEEHTGRTESFAAIGRELGANRIRAQAIFRNAIQRLGANDEARGLARYLADLNAVLCEEEPAERASRPVPVIEKIDGSMLEEQAWARSRLIGALMPSMRRAALAASRAWASVQVNAMSPSSPPTKHVEISARHS